MFDPVNKQTAAQGATTTSAFVDSKRPASRASATTTTITPSSVPKLSLSLIRAEPSTPAQVEKLIAVVAEKRADFEALQAKGANYQIKVTAYPKGSENASGGANALREHSVAASIKPDDPVAKQAADLINLPKRSRENSAQGTAQHVGVQSGEAGRDTYQEALNFARKQLPFLHIASPSDQTK